jgi:phage pi2 protein 07
MAIIDEDYMDAVNENRKRHAAEQDAKNKARIAANESKGFVLVHTGDGWEIWKQKNIVGGWTYYSDKNSNEGALAIFDNAVIDKEELIAIAKDGYGLELKTPS